MNRITSKLGMSIEKETPDNQSDERIHNPEEGIYNIFYEKRLNIHTL